MGKRDICRAITFISYNIPIAKEGQTDNDPDYSTIGFFDGLITKSIEVDYQQKSFKKLWEYSIEMSLKSEGKYSYHNIFCFSKDKWNFTNDDDFWRYETDVKYPLTFIVFFQLSQYNVEKNSLYEQLTKFNNKLKQELNGQGLFYSYITIDKNDFVVCIKSEGYKKILDVIKKLHDIDKNVIYSYTTLSINNNVLEGLNSESYHELYNEVIDSISLKGVTNSYNLSDKMTLEKKYRGLASELREVLWTEENKESFEIYDILGDDDFRFVAQNVNLGCLLEQYGQKGKLSYNNDNGYLDFYLYSSSMRFNVRNAFVDDIGQIDLNEIKKIENEMSKEFIPDLCNKMESELKEIRSYIQYASENYLKDERISTICQSIWQILQSLKALERAPTKHYDFFTLYIPFKLFVELINEKLMNNESIEYTNVYDFIRKVSMTIQGTLKTDIQFFQVNDYNAIAHYAPTKLRAFYSTWALKLTEFYNALSEKSPDIEYSFIFSPGVFSGTQVRELFERTQENKHLMLITIPERHIYVPKWTIIILGHEVGHFVGHTLRNRELRREKLTSIAVRLLTLEWNRSFYLRIKDKNAEKITEYMAQESQFQQMLLEMLQSEVKAIDEERGGNPDLHSEETLLCISNGVSRIIGIHGESIVDEYIVLLDVYLDNMIQAENINESFQILNEIKENTEIAHRGREDYKRFLSVFRETNLLESSLGLIKYLMSEMFSDLISVLTLSLSPDDYMLAFKNSEYLDSNESMERCAAPVHVRIAIVIKVIKQLVKENKQFFGKDERMFVKKWEECEWIEFAKGFSEEAVVEDLILLAYDYQASICDFKKNIKSYHSLYENRKDINTIATYLLDEEVYTKMFEYLLKCGNDYIKQVQMNPEHVSKRGVLRKMYELIERGDSCEIVQGIEGFLYDFEHNIRENLKKNDE